MMGRFAIAAMLTICGAVHASWPTLEWENLPSISNAHGFGGPFVGVHNGALLVAGGANFPAGPPWGATPGKKVWHDEILVLASPGGVWQKAGNLPKRLAYGACVSMNDGVLLIGGEEDGTAIDNVWKLQWRSGEGKASLLELPALPAPSAYLSAGIIGSQVYVSASHRSEGADRLDQKAFWSLDLTSEELEWKSLPTWPGAARHKAVAAVQLGPSRESNFFLISGSNPRFDEQSEADLAKFEFYTDGFRFDPKQRRWHPIAELPAVENQQVPEDEPRFGDTPRAVAAASGMGIGDTHVLVFSGATGRYLTREVQERPLFPTDVLAYDTQIDLWSVVSQMPEGVVTTGIVKWQNKVVLASGEIRPGVRTRHIQAATVQWNAGISK